MTDIRFSSFLLISVLFDPLPDYLPQEQITNMNDAKEEVELAIEDEARLKVGEVFMVMSQDDVVAAIEANIAALEKKQADVTTKLETINSNLALYKRELYTKFGTDNINLED